MKCKLQYQLQSDQAMEIFLAILLRTAGEMTSATVPLGSRSKRLQTKSCVGMEEVYISKLTCIGHGCKLQPTQQYE